MGWYAQMTCGVLMWPHSRIMSALGCQISCSKASPLCLSCSPSSSLYSTLILPWGCSCANCFLHLHIQAGVLTLSPVNPRMPLPSMEPILYLTFNSVFRELFSSQRYDSLLPFTYWEEKCLPFSRAGLWSVLHFGSLCVPTTCCVSLWMLLLSEGSWY